MVESQGKVSEKSGNFEMDIEWQPWKCYKDQNLKKVVCPSLIPETFIPKLAGDKNISILHLSCRMSDLKFSLLLQTHALVL